MAAAPAGGGTEASPPARPEVLLERGAGDIGDRDAATLGLVAKPGVEVVGKLHGGAAHGDASIPFDFAWQAAEFKGSKARRAKPGLAQSAIATVDSAPRRTIESNETAAGTRIEGILEFPDLLTGTAAQQGCSSRLSSGAVASGHNARSRLGAMAAAASYRLVRHPWGCLRLLAPAIELSAPSRACR